MYTNAKSHESVSHHPHIWCCHILAGKIIILHSHPQYVKDIFMEDCLATSVN